jgi:AraC-like DNA-binding protein
MPTEEAIPVICFKRSFELFEQLAEATYGWDLDFRQLKRNTGPFGLEQLVSPRMLYSRAGFDSPFYQLGGPLLGFRTFALQANGCSGFNWCGRGISGQSLIIFPCGGDFESNTQPGFDVFTLSLSEAVLEHVAKLHYQRPLSDFIGSGREVCDRSAGAVIELRAMLHSLSINVGRWSASQCQPGGPELAALEEKLAELVLKCLERGEVKSADRKLSRRMKALGTVLATIEDTQIEVLNLPEIMKQVDVSRRTIEHAFQDRFDVSPAVYIKAIRLKALNKTLLLGDKRELSVREICQRHGFHHLGQLANDYTKLFGELPSTTLRRHSQLG